MYEVMDLHGNNDWYRSIKCLIFHKTLSTECQIFTHYHFKMGQISLIHKLGEFLKSGSQKCQPQAIKLKYTKQNKGR